MRQKPPEICPVCHEEVPRSALACPECGADHQSGWQADSTIYDGLDLPDEEFDYDEFVKQEFGSSPKPRAVKTIWWITAVVLIVVLIATYIGMVH